LGNDQALGFEFAQPASCTRSVLVAGDALERVEAACGARATSGDVPVDGDE
jgi:hypothetical protein